jgi:hypothetical protein
MPALLTTSEYEGGYLCLRYEFHIFLRLPCIDDVRIDEVEDKHEDREGLETIMMDGETLGIHTSAIGKKCQAFETLVFAPYLARGLEVSLPALQFYSHDGE